MIELYPANCTKFMLGVIYRPPNSDEDILMELRASLERLDESCQLVLVGDFTLPNIDWSLDFPSPNSEGGFKEELFCEIIADLFLYQMATVRHICVGINWTVFSAIIRSSSLMLTV